MRDKLLEAELNGRIDAVRDLIMGVCLILITKGIMTQDDFQKILETKPTNE